MVPASVIALINTGIIIRQGIGYTILCIPPQTGLSVDRYKSQTNYWPDKAQDGPIMD
jgi:hypothetical protein